MAIVNGTLTDFGLDPLALNDPVLIFRASSTGIAGLNLLSASKAVEAYPAYNGFFEVDLVSTSLISPETTHYTVEIRYRDTLTRTLTTEKLPWQLLVPPEGGALGDLLRVSANPALVWTGAEPPPAPTPGNWWLNPDTGDLQELDPDAETWIYKANLRGPAGYNATGAAEDDAAIAALIREDNGPTAVADALTVVIAEAGAATFTRINDRGHSLASSLALKSGDVVIGLAGDSTGDAPDEWFYRILQLLGADDPALRISYMDWESGSHLQTQIQAGAPRFVVVKEDLFDRTAADLYGSLATTGNSSWFGNYSGSAGDWSVDGSAAVKTTDTVVGEMLISTGAMDNTRTAVHYVSVSSFAGSVTTDFVIRRTTSGDNLYVRLVVDNVGGTYQAAVRQTISGVNTTIISGSTFSIPSDRRFEITLDVAGTDVTLYDNTSTRYGTLTPANAAILNLGDRQGFVGRGNNTGDRVEFFSAQRIDPPRTLTAYNGSIAGSTLTDQQALLGAMFPAPLDLLFISSSHNYGADTAATYTAKLDLFIRAALALHPSAGIVIGSQNPKFSPFSGDQRDNHRTRCRAARTYALAHGYGYLPVMEAFDAEPDGGASGILPDGLHPNPAGSDLWAAAAKSYIDSLAL